MPRLTTLAFFVPVVLSACGAIPLSEEQLAESKQLIADCRSSGGFERTKVNGKFWHCSYPFTAEENAYTERMAVACMQGGMIPTYDYRYRDSDEPFQKFKRCDQAPQKTEWKPFTITQPQTTEWKDVTPKTTTCQHSGNTSRCKTY
jgi:hypothetical protein